LSIFSTDGNPAGSRAEVANKAANNGPEVGMVS
jgi:hypothetical protein